MKPELATAARRQLRRMDIAVPNPDDALMSVAQQLFAGSAARTNEWGEHTAARELFTALATRWLTISGPVLTATPVRTSFNSSNGQHRDSRLLTFS